MRRVGGEKKDNDIKKSPVLQARGLYVNIIS